MAFPTYSKTFTSLAVWLLIIQASSWTSTLAFPFGMQPYLATTTTIPSLHSSSFQTSSFPIMTLHSSSPSDNNDAATTTKTQSLPRIEITYCTGCRWMMRAAWLAQELLTTFEGELHSVALVPSSPDCAGGIFVVKLDDKTIWDRKAEGRHAEAKELKRRVRDIINPARDLGHSDVKTVITDDAVHSLSDDEAEEQRQFFGVA